MISDTLNISIENNLSEHLSEKISITDHHVIGGGSINDAYGLATNHGKFFLKVNSASRYPNMFKCEAQGLQCLGQPGVIDVPGIVTLGEAGDEAYLVMEFIESGSQGKDFWHRFGIRLAALHRETADRFGFESDNYIGSLSQRNTWHSDWVEFFIQERLEPLVKTSRDKGALNKESHGHFERLYTKLDRFFPTERPSLIHGDLWSGNFACNKKGDPVIFDPAVYYGHREMDLAMSRLFGGFPKEFYDVYNDHFPIEQGWKERVDVLNLYPLMVHVNLFGGSYLYDVHRILQRMV